jgi:uncharacterized protein YukE
MPTFQQCLDADPEELRALAETVRGAVAKLARLGLDYSDTVLALSPPWHGEDHRRLLGWANQVTEYIRRSDEAWIDSAAALDYGGHRMGHAVATMKALKQTAERAGHRIGPGPAVGLGPAQWARVASAGAEGPLLLRAFESAAMAYETALASLYVEVVSEDVLVGAAIRLALRLENAELDRIYEQTCAAIEALGMPLWNRPEDRDRGGAHVELDGRVAIAWMPRVGADSDAAQDEIELARLEAILQDLGFEVAEAADSDGCPMLEVSNAPARIVTGPETP